jgi:antitoxin (DNA-binding transcriptional repressor) of toxin-antitoxin stability system
VKVVGLQQANLEECVRQSQDERVVLTRKGKPVALLVGVQGLNLEQIELGQSDEFWKPIQDRRGQKTISRGEMDELLRGQPKTRK